ncbi:glucuronate isomerase [Flagellimonas aequoris]|uniref:Uronate isomerase n=1 Tax=Flagellimonas aequoris TaxID=2306997 RepID=A0A418N376_9FLAO|nr:glucuronate isomerase [Allomuricauda aequoris]RIV68273.1 glucuronate isomerase [Allomuricauda aequoris]TXJ99964.1 glucuronate isomerase [Allomuricauda aequoris]
MTFIKENFLLETPQAEELYHNYAKEMPIIDYHNHLPPEYVANHHQFKNLTEAWLSGDHYKWRAMRALGIDECYITGNASDQEKFQKWAETVPYTLRNPLYHWTHLELLRYFGIEALLTEKNAEHVFQETKKQLQEKSHSAVGLLQQFNVEVICTTDDPIEKLEHHEKVANEGTLPRMLPTFRPDKIYAVENNTAYRSYLESLGEISGVLIKSYQDLIMAIKNRVAYFHENGCRLSDHGLEQLYHFEMNTFNIEKIFKKVMDGHPLKVDEIQYFKFETLVHLCREYHKLGWVQQFHLGALRNTNKKMLAQLGPDAGFDSMGDFPQAINLAKFLDTLESSDQLGKTILYNINPAHNEVFATMAGNFNGGNIKGKVQFGSGWWYMDQLDGMERQLNALSNMGLLSCFVGMLTDSRSFLSFPRHEYFRRLLCNILGNDIKKGLVPNDIAHIGGLVQDICYQNAKTYFNLGYN